MFATDIDLLTTEPNLFAEVGWSAQRLVSAIGALSGTTLTLAGADLAAAQVDAGCVVLMNGVPLEVVARTSATTLTVSLVRWGQTGPAIPPVGMISGACEVNTFRPQIEIAHRHILRLLGIAAGPPGVQAGGSDAPPMGESAIVNGGDFVRFESLLALHDIYASAGAAAPSGSPLAARAAQFRIRAGTERTRLAAQLDTDGDGHVDATRRAAVIPFVRG